MNEKNVIGMQSDLYKQLLDVYTCYDANVPSVKRERYARCYEIVDNSSYYEICFVISRMKELKDIENTAVEGLQVIIELINRLFVSKEAIRDRFLLGILEEARERKRTTTK